MQIRQIPVSLLENMKSLEELAFIPIETQIFLKSLLHFTTCENISHKILFLSFEIYGNDTRLKIFAWRWKIEIFLKAFAAQEKMIFISLEWFSRSTSHDCPQITNEKSYNSLESFVKSRI